MHTKTWFYKNILTHTYTQVQLLKSPQNLKNDLQTFYITIHKLAYWNKYLCNFPKPSVKSYLRT